MRMAAGLADLAVGMDVIVIVAGMIVRMAAERLDDRGAEGRRLRGGMHVTSVVVRMQG